MIVLLLISVGVIGGVINAIAGGGAILMLPVLLWAGNSPVSATATISLAVLPGIIAATYGYKKEIQSSPKTFIWLLLPIALGAYFGAKLLIKIDPGQFATIIPWLVLSAVLLLGLQTRIHKIIVTEKHLIKTNRRLGLPILFIAVFILAIYGGFFGVGVGLMIMALLGLSSRIKTTYQLSALKNLLMIGIACIAFFSFINAGLVNVNHGLIIATGSTIGGYSGSRISKYVSSHTVHNVTVLMGIAIVLYLFVS